MKKLLILSGKGGTGKTTAAAAFIRFSQARAFADCDVDAPNLHLVTERKSDPETRDYHGSQKAEIDPDRCSGCGLCAQACRFDAIGKTNGTYQVNEYACEGCGVCAYVCPSGAAALHDDVAGQVTLYPGESVFVTAELKMGRGNSGKLVSDVKSTLYEGRPADRVFHYRRFPRYRLPRDRVHERRGSCADRNRALRIRYQRSGTHFQNRRRVSNEDRRMCKQVRPKPGACRPD